MTEAPLPADYYQSAMPVVTDWGHCVSFTPSTYHAPASVEDLGLLLTQLLTTLPPGKTVRFLGGLHSCSEIFADDIVIDTSRLPLEFSVEPIPGGGGTVVASATMHAHDFLARAAVHGLSLTATGGTDAQTLAGLISTNTAGATSQSGIYDCVDWIELFAPAADGKSFELKRVARTDPAFAWTVCSLGVLGFITRVGFTLVPQLFYAATFEIAELDAVLTDPFATSAKYEFWRIEWIPNTTHGLFWHAAPIPSDGVDPDGDYPAEGDAAEGVIKWLIKLDENILKSGPFLNAPLAGVYALMARLYGVSTTKGPLRHMIPCDRLAPVRVSQAEWGFDLADLQKVIALCRTYFTAPGNAWPNLPIEIELCRTDPYLMSPWNWPGLPAIVKFNFQHLTDYLDAAGLADVFASLEGLWNALVAAGIPFKAHWGKINFLTTDFVRANYQLDAFAPHIRPMFVNASLAKRLM